MGCLPICVVKNKPLFTEKFVMVYNYLSFGKNIFSVYRGFTYDIFGVMDKLVGFFSEFSSCGQNGWCFFQQNDYP